MNWGDVGLFAQRIFFCTVSASVAGSVLTILSGFLSRYEIYRNSELCILGIKTALILYIVPIAAGLVVLSRTNISFSGIIWNSFFWNVTTSPMQRIYLFLSM